jgi:hypothetical protein
MRHECQVYLSGGEQCGFPAVDYAEQTFPGGDTVRIWMCAPHWDEHKRRKRDEGKPAA